MSFKNKSPEQRTLEKKAEGKITKRNKPLRWYARDVADTSPKTYGLTKRRAP